MFHKSEARFQISNFHCHAFLTGLQPGIAKRPRKREKRCHEVKVDLKLYKFSWNNFKTHQLINKSGHLPDPLPDQRLQVPPRWELSEQFAVSAGEQTVCVSRRSAQRHRTVTLTSSYISFMETPNETTSHGHKKTRTNSNSEGALVIISVV